MSTTLSPIWRASALGNNGQSANSATCVITIPASAMTGDFARVVVAANTNAQTNSPPSGWFRQNGPTTSGTVLRVYCYWKFLAGTPGQISSEAGTTATFTWTASLITPGIMDVYYNVDQGTPYGTFTVTSSAVTNTVLTGGPFTVNANNLIDNVYIGRTAATINTQPSVGASGTNEGFCSTNYAAAVNISLASAYTTAVTAARNTAAGGLSETYTNTNTNWHVYQGGLQGNPTVPNNYQFVRGGDGLSFSERIR